jgi:hypothetical protein
LVSRRAARGVSATAVAERERGDAEEEEEEEEAMAADEAARGRRKASRS